MTNILDINIERVNERVDGIACYDMKETQ